MSRVGAAEDVDSDAGGTDADAPVTPALSAGARLEDPGATFGGRRMELSDATDRHPSLADALEDERRRRRSLEASVTLLARALQLSEARRESLEAHPRDSRSQSAPLDVLPASPMDEAEVDALLRLAFARGADAVTQPTTASAAVQASLGASDPKSVPERVRKDRARLIESARKQSQVIFELHNQVKVLRQLLDASMAVPARAQDAAREELERTRADFADQLARAKRELADAHERMALDARQSAALEARLAEAVGRADRLAEDVHVMSAELGRRRMELEVAESRDRDSRELVQSLGAQLRTRLLELTSSQEQVRSLEARLERVEEARVRVEVALTQAEAARTKSETALRELEARVSARDESLRERERELRERERSLRDRESDCDLEVRRLRHALSVAMQAVVQGGSDEESGPTPTGEREADENESGADVAAEALSRLWQLRGRLEAEASPSSDPVRALGSNPAAFVVELEEPSRAPSPPPADSAKPDEPRTRDATEAPPTAARVVPSAPSAAENPVASPALVQRLDSRPSSASSRASPSAASSLLSSPSRTLIAKPPSSLSLDLIRNTGPSSPLPTTATRAPAPSAIPRSRLAVGIRAALADRAAFAGSDGKTALPSLMALWSARGRGSRRR